MVPVMEGTITLLLSLQAQLPAFLPMGVRNQTGSEYTPNLHLSRSPW